MKLYNKANIVPQRTWPESWNLHQGLGCSDDNGRQKPTLSLASAAKSIKCKISFMADPTGILTQSDQAVEWEGGRTIMTSWQDQASFHTQPTLSLTPFLSLAASLRAQGITPAHPRSHQPTSLCNPAFTLSLP